MKRLLILMILACGTALAGDGHLSLPYIRWTLPNGLDVILHEDHSVSTIAVDVWYHVGSAREKPGKTGFAHLFEHLMFEGSQHVPQGKFDEWLEAAGGDNNGSTTNDRTNYYEVIPNNALALPLFLESDRMGFLVEAMSPGKVNAQRDVVKNERRENYDNEPYGLASLSIEENLFPENHPYHWPVIGSMEDLASASYQDVVDFFRKYYVPSNATLVIAGDVNVDTTKDLVETWFHDVPGGPAVPPQAAPPVFLTEQKRVVLEDRVQLPRLYIAWPTPPVFAPGDAEMDVLATILAGGKNSRLYKRLVYELQVAQDVSAFQDGRRLASIFEIVVTAREGHRLREIEKLVWEEIRALTTTPPAPREVERAVNQIEASFLDRLESVQMKAELLNMYVAATGNPDYLNEDLARYKAIDPGDIQAMTATYLRADGCVVLSVFPLGKPELAAPKEGRP